MKIIDKSVDLQSTIAEAKSQGLRVGFVPTMGALHDGHLTLVKQAKAENDLCVVSVFVNPTQFNNPDDLLKYPRTPEQDCDLLAGVGCDVVFLPSVEEVYPETDTRIFDFGLLERVMEGKMRPGHFNGVAQVVSRLFDLVNADVAYFGEKDFQQVAIIRAMVEQLNYPISIQQVPIVREGSGLALSSRNMRLSAEEKVQAISISQALFQSKERMNQLNLAQTQTQVIEHVNAHPAMQVEYFEIVDGNTLEPVQAWEDSNYIVGCIASFCGEVRLIDNIIYKNN